MPACSAEVQASQGRPLLRLYFSFLFLPANSRAGVLRHALHSLCARASESHSASFSELQLAGRAQRPAAALETPSSSSVTSGHNEAHARVGGVTASNTLQKKKKVPSCTFKHFFFLFFLESCFFFFHLNALSHMCKSNSAHLHLLNALNHQWEYQDSQYRHIKTYNPIVFFSV